RRFFARRAFARLTGLAAELVQSGLRARFGRGRVFAFFHQPRFGLLRVRVAPGDAADARPRGDAAAFRIGVGEAALGDLRPQRAQRRRVFGVGTDHVEAFVGRRGVAVGDPVDAGDAGTGFAGRAGRLRDRGLAFGRQLAGQIRFEGALAADVAAQEGGHRRQPHLLLIAHQGGVAGDAGVDQRVDLFGVVDPVRLGFAFQHFEVGACFAREADAGGVGGEGAPFGPGAAADVRPAGGVFGAGVVAVGLPDGVVGVVVAADLDHLEPRVGVAFGVLAAFVEAGPLEVGDVAVAAAEERHVGDAIRGVAL